MSFGPWIQPSDLWGPSIATVRGVRAIKNGDAGNPDSDPDDISVTEADLDFPSAGLVFDSQFLSILAQQSIIEFNPAAEPDHMPQVAPGSLPAGAIGVDYEAAAGTATGDIEITDWGYKIEYENHPIGVNDAHYNAQVVTAASTLRRIPNGLLTLGGDGRYHCPSDWIDRPTRTTYAVVFTAAIPAGTSGTSFQTVGPTDVTTPITFAAATLEDGRAYLLADVDPPTGQVNFDGLDAFGDTGQAGVGFDMVPDDPLGGFTYRVFYTPPRYRFIYSALPPLRQYPRDDAAGGAPRNGKMSRSTQGSARQGWANTYR